MSKNKIFVLIISVFTLVSAVAIFFACGEDNGGEVSVTVSELSEFSDIIDQPITPEESFVPEVSVNTSAEESFFLPENSEVSAEASVQVPEVSTHISDEVSSENSLEVSENSGEVSEEITKITLPVITVSENTDICWDGTSADSFEKGSGTQQDPYIISTAQQLAYFRDSVNNGESYKGKYIKLENSIKLSDIQNNPVFWKAIGTEKNPFCGVFEGGNNVIYGLYGEGLFGFIRGSIKNIGISDSNITYGGGLVATAARDYSVTETPYITNCFITNSSVIGAGGVIGYAGGYSVSDCINDAFLTGNDDWFGGVIGQAAKCSVSDCFNFGAVEGDTICGGVVGNAFDSVFNGCFNIGCVNGTGFSGSFAGVSYGAVFSECGCLSEMCEYLIYDEKGNAFTEYNGISVYQKDGFN